MSTKKRRFVICKKYLNIKKKVPSWLWGEPPPFAWGWLRHRLWWALHSSSLGSFCPCLGVPGWNGRHRQRLGVRSLKKKMEWGNTFGCSDVGRTNVLGLLGFVESTFTFDWTLLNGLNLGGCGLGWSLHLFSNLYLFFWSFWILLFRKYRQEI